MLTIVILIFLVIGAIDYLLENRYGIGAEFEKGISMLGTLMISMTGMLILAPTISHFLGNSIVCILPEFIDPSIISASLLANDMGGASLSQELCRNGDIGGFNAMIVSSMMGCTVSFTIPVALGLVDKTKYKTVIYGILCGIITIPIGCFVGGIVAGIPATALIINLIPLIMFSVILSFGLYKFPDVSMKIFLVLGKCIKVIIIVGLVSGIIEFLTGYKIIPYSDTLENGTRIIVNAACVMAGSFPLIHIISKILKKFLKYTGEKIGINETSAMGIISSLATSIPTFKMMKDMDDKGALLNSAFAVSGAFVFAGHLAFTLAFDQQYVVSVITGKLVAAIFAVVLANALYKKLK